MDCPVLHDIRHKTPTKTEGRAICSIHFGPLVRSQTFFPILLHGFDLSRMWIAEVARILYAYQSRIIDTYSLDATFSRVIHP